MILVTQLTLPSVVEEDAGLDGLVIQKLHLIELVTNVLTVVLYRVFVEEGVVLGVQDHLLAVIRVLSVDRLRQGGSLNYRPEQLENLFLYLPRRRVFVHDYDSRLRQSLLGLEEKVAGPLLSDHELDRYELTRVPVMILPLDGHKFEASVNPTDLEVVSRHHVYLVVTHDTDYGRANIVNCHIFVVL